MQPFQTLFQHRITTEEELRGLLGHPGELATRKVISRLDPHCRDWIARSPFLLLSTSDAAGSCDASPRGDAPGFVRVLDERCLVIPERPGNRRVDSLRNILANPRVGLLFLIPGLDETLRINGRAFLTRDPDLLRPMAVNRRLPLVGIVVEVEECFVHCGKAMRRSRLWDPAAWPEPSALPSVGRMLSDHVRLPDFTPGKVEKLLEESYTKRMY